MAQFQRQERRRDFATLKDRVFPFIKNELGKDEQSAFSHYMSDALFLFPTPQIVERVVTGLDDLYQHDLSGLDVQGDLYEYMLDKLATSGKTGNSERRRKSAT